MAYLYVTTDSIEAKALIEDTFPSQKSKCNYHDIEPIEGQNLVSRTGFNPMCSIKMNGNISADGLDAIATNLIKEGFYVATEFNGKILKYFPHDTEVKEEIVKLALQRAEAMADLLLYSNNPHKIKDFWNSGQG